MNAPVAIAPAFRLNPKQKVQRDMAASPARYLLAYGGSRSGKTFGWCRCIATRALKAPGSKHLIYRKTVTSAKAALAGQNGTLLAVMRLCFPGQWFNYHKQDGIFEFGNGSEIWLGGLDSHNLEKVLGNEYATIMGNELSETPHSTFEVMVTRLAQVVEQDAGLGLLPQKFYGDLNPTARSHWTYRMWQDLVNPETEELLPPEDYAFVQMNPRDNTENLDPRYIASLQKLGERARRRFWDGEYSADAENALWRRSMIQRTQQDVRNLARIVVAVDPSVSNEPGSDETGLVAMGIDAPRDGNAFVLADDSGKMRAEEWARRAVALYHQLNADCIVAEVNNGGDLVENQIRAMVRPGEEQPRIRKVHATRGKYVRAEPIAGLYERGKVFHCGEFQQLEDQMCMFTADFDRKAMGVSPDRLDALVWAGTELFGDMTKKKIPAQKPAPPRRPVANSWMGL